MGTTRCWKWGAVWMAALSLLLGGAGSRAFSAPAWQLTFSYDDRGLFLLRAAAMPALAKAVRTPGLDGAVLKLDYELQWLDPQGQVLLAVPVTIPLGSRVALGLDPVKEPDRGQVMSEGAFVLRVEGPADASKVVQVRLARRASGMGLLPANPARDVELPAAFEPAEQTFPMPVTPVVQMAAPGPLSVSQVRNTGPDANRLVIVFLSDGFTSADLAAGSFSNKVSAFLNTLLGVSPWNLYAQLVNAYRIDIISTQSGADYEDKSPAEGGTLKDTYLNTAFWVGGIERCLSPTGDGTAKAFAAADELVGAGVWDEILVFVNSQKYGGCGGSVGTSSLNSSSDQVQVHEFGHSFANLADEYDYGSASTNCSPSGAPNVDCATAFPHVKWDPWVVSGTPIPTPDTPTYDSVVGAFEGAAYQAKGMFRPRRNCYMRSLGAAFCPVCKEAHILSLFERIRMVDVATPAFGPAEVPSYGARLFTVTPVRASSFSYRWLLGGIPLAEGTNASISVAANQFTGTNVELRLDVTHVTTNVRAQPIVQTDVWQLRSADLPVIRIADASVSEGQAGGAQLRFAATLTFPHDQAVSVQYATADGTASAGSDYLTKTGTLTFAPGQTTNLVAVMINNDGLAEPNEVLFVNLFNPAGAALGDSQASGTILDDDNPPVVVITSPPNGAAFYSPLHLTVAASPTDYDGRITNVQFSANGTALGEAIFRPFSVTWSNVNPGRYLLSALARDNAGRAATSAPVQVTVLATSTQGWVLVSITNDWRYDASTNDYGTAWKEPDYPDSLWAGPARPLFYNESARLPAPTNTWLPLTDPSGTRLRSYYFRTHFDWPSNDHRGLMLVSSNLVDDGAVFWLNGVELGRLRMSAGAITRASLANGIPPNSGDATVFEVLNFPAGALRLGDNVLAVEVHQQTDTSTDVVFGMSLAAVEGIAPVLLETNQLVSTTVLQGRPFTMSVTATGSVPLACQWFHDGVPINGGTNAAFRVASMDAAHAGAYFVRLTNPAGTLDSPSATLDYAADASPPAVVYALGSNNPARILVSFSEPVESASAAQSANYHVSPAGGGAALAISSVVVVNGTNVLLTTSLRAPDTNYVLTVNNVRDLFSNVVASNSQISIASEVVVLADDNQLWRYFQSDDAPSAGWMLSGFDVAPAPWSTGPALFDAKEPMRASIGTEPVRTQLSLANPPAAPKPTLAYYFRTVFSLPGPADGVRLKLRLLVDDGAVFYLNGAEVYRLRMPGTPAVISYTNLATVGVNDGVYEGPFELPGGALLAGPNVFAAEVHQNSGTSSDISFAAQLVAEMPQIGFPPLELAIVPGTNGVILRWSRAEAQLQDGPAALGPWNDVQPPPVSPYPVEVAGPARFFRLRAP